MKELMKVVTKPTTAWDHHVYSLEELYSIEELKSSISQFLKEECDE